VTLRRHLRRHLRPSRGVRALAAVGLLAACSASTGAEWVAQTPASRDGGHLGPDPPGFRAPSDAAPYRRSLRSRRIGVDEQTPAPRRGEEGPALRLEGNVLGTFRNTYYDFPEERNHEGPQVSLFDSKCEPLASVPLGFHDAVCVQGSGLLSRGQTVSFARRGCECARTCPRTEQQICFDALDPARFPWGRGASGRPITPLLSVAVDSDVIPLGTPLFIPEYVGIPRDPGRQSLHDGCFLAEDRGLKVRGQHVDIFTGEESLTRFWNELVPSNGGVRVVLDSPYCQRADATLAAEFGSTGGSAGGGSAGSGK
jgi:3D (Asp-Asp-Asp) domain-containing protein